MILHSDYIEVCSEETNCAIVRVDLSEYINAFINNNDKYQKLHAHFRYITSAFMSESLFLLVMDTISKKQNAIMQENICSTPAYNYLREYFVEIFKNTIDETIIRCCSVLDTPAVAILSLRIEYSPTEDRIKFMLQDQGAGFSERFLELTSSPVKQDDYMKGKGSAKPSLRESQPMPNLFGGFGRGIRNIIACVLTGSDLSSHGRLIPLFTRPRYSTINFSNSPEGGAVIAIESSCEPLLRVEQRPCSPMRLFLPKKFFKNEFSERVQVTNMQEHDEVQLEKIPHGS